MDANWEQFLAALTALNNEFIRQRMAVEANHRQFLARCRKSPHRRTVWYHSMPDDAPRECQYCGTLFLPGPTRQIGIVAAPPSVVDAHRRAHCSYHCDRSNLSGLRYVRIKRAEIFERDNWRCYLCDDPTPAELRGFGYVPIAPSIDHVIPKGWGTDEPDNLRCCCKQCNLEKGTSTLWQKLTIYIGPDVSPRIFSDILLQVLPRHPTLDEMTGLWRRHIIHFGKPIEDIYQSPFLDLVCQLTER